MENLPTSKIEEDIRFQGLAVYALLSEVLEMVDLKRWIWDEEGESCFYLRYVFFPFRSSRLRLT